MYFFVITKGRIMLEFQKLNLKKDYFNILLNQEKVL